MDEPARTSRERPLVLIVEDQCELRQLYTQELVFSGFDVIEAGNGVEAIEHARSRFPDVVLMDLSLPVMDGWEATRRLKDDAQTMRIPIVALTAHHGSGELQQATQAGCDWFVPKPCQPHDLIEEVRRILGADDPLRIQRVTQI